MRLDLTTEAELVRKAQRGDTAAAEALVLANRHLARAAASRLSHPTLGTDDVEQECLLVIFRAIPRFDPARGVRFTSYAGRCVQHKLADLVAGIRRQQLSEGHDPYSLTIPPTQHTSSRGEAPEDPALARDDPEPDLDPLPPLKSLLRLLPAPWRRLIELLYGLDALGVPRSLRDACLILGVNRKTGQRWRRAALMRMRWSSARVPAHAGVTTREPANA